MCNNQKLKLKLKHPASDKTRAGEKLMRYIKVHACSLSTSFFISILMFKFFNANIIQKEQPHLPEKEIGLGKEKESFETPCSGLFSLISGLPSKYTE